MNEPLPPKELRKGYGDLTDQQYCADACRLIGLVAELCVVADGNSDALAGKRWLDFGCGAVKLLTGLRLLQTPLVSYLGVDVDRRCIDWAQSRLHDERYCFRHRPAHNERYNPSGDRLPFHQFGLPPASFDVIVLRSVLTHMLLPDVQGYLSALAELLAPGGLMYASAFVEENVPVCEENPLGYRGCRGVTGRCHVVRYNKRVFEDVIASAGLRVAAFTPDSQDQAAYLLRR